MSYKDWATRTSGGQGYSATPDPEPPYVYGDESIYLLWKKVQTLEYELRKLTTFVEDVKNGSYKKTMVLDTTPGGQLPNVEAVQSPS